MSCRCEEIESIRSKITKLAGSIDKLNSYDSKLSGMTMQTGMMAVNIGWTITSGFAASVNEKLQKIPAGFGGVGSSVRAKIASKCSELQSELETLETEDRWHHEEEERQRRRREINRNVPNKS